MKEKRKVDEQSGQDVLCHQHPFFPLPFCPRRSVSLWTRLVRFSSRRRYCFCSPSEAYQPTWAGDKRPERVSFLFLLLFLACGTNSRRPNFDVESSMPRFMEYHVNAPTIVKTPTTRDHSALNQRKRNKKRQIRTNKGVISVLPPICIPSNSKRLIHSTSKQSAAPSIELRGNFFVTAYLWGPAPMNSRKVI